MLGLLLGHWRRFPPPLPSISAAASSIYEIWNEPNIAQFWKPGRPDARLYVRPVRQTAPTVRQRVPNAVIIGGALAGLPLGYLEECFVVGLAEHVDALSCHPYREIPERHYEADVGAMRRLPARYNTSRVNEAEFWGANQGPGRVARVFQPRCSMGMKLLSGGPT